MSGDKIAQAKEALEFILRNLNPDDRFAVVAFSDYPRAKTDSLLLDRLSQENHGTTVYVTPDDNLERAISSFYRKISSPVLTSPRVEIAGVKTYDAYPNPLPDVFRGSQLLYVGRYEEGGEGEITLSGAVGGKTVSFSAVHTLPETESVRVVGDRAFFLKDGIWIDSTYSDEETIKIKAYSSAYFDLLTLKPELAAYLALGDQLILKVGTVYVEIGPVGVETLTDEIREKING